MPEYQHASYAGETVTLKNATMRLEVHKRLSGWGWAEIFTAEGLYLGVLEHLGEIMLRDQDIPMRLEAEEVRHEVDEAGESLVFAVRSTVVQQKLQGTSFEQWVQYPFREPCIVGEVRLTLLPEAPILHLRFAFESIANVYARYIRGPWLKVGADGSSGVAKADAILPGVEWLLDDEWSSGTDWFKDPWARRWMPHRHKVAIPVMAISHGGTALGLAWNVDLEATQWFNYRQHFAQPVFASPNFLDRQNNHLLGLMVPDCATELDENQIYANEPLELHPGQRIVFEAEIFLCAGDSLDAVVDLVRRNGLPALPEPRWPLPEALHRIASAYNTRFWYQDQGFGTAQHPPVRASFVPHFLERYLHEYAGTPLAQELQEKRAWCQQQGEGAHAVSWSGRDRWLLGLDQQAQVEHGRALLAAQREDGAFPFDPEGRHYRKDDFVVARAFIEPMGLVGDTALSITVAPATELLLLGQTTGQAAFLEGARKAFDYCLSLRRPEGGDFWETPLHSPNLLAAGQAALAYYQAFTVFGEPAYRASAIRWMRSLLPFTHLWQPEQVAMLYNTKPCLCASDWYFANWVRDHVQWEVLEIFASLAHYEIDWAQVDQEIDWRRYQEGITVAALRWMVDHTRGHWRPHNLPSTLEAYQQGLLDDCFADTHNSVTGNYGGMVIAPDVIAVNIMQLLAYQRASER